MNDSKLIRQETHYGLIAISRGESTFNAVVYSTEGEFYFYPVSLAEANELEDWIVGVTTGSADWEDLADILPFASDYDLDMMYCGEPLDD